MACALRSAARSLHTVARRGLAVSSARSSAHADNIMEKWPPEKFDNHFITYLNRPEIDGWEVRKALTEIHDYDVIPDPKVVESALRACRRVNDYGLAVRFLEALKIKCGTKSNRDTIYPYIINQLERMSVVSNVMMEVQVRSTLDELGISTPEDLGLDKPEFFIPQPEYYWEKKWYADYGLNKKPGMDHL